MIHDRSGPLAPTLSGRWFRLETPLRGVDLTGKAMSADPGTGWRPSTGSVPWSILSGVDRETPLSWRDDSTGVLRFFFRQETRGAVPHSAVEVEADRRVRAQTGHSLSSFPQRVRKRYAEEARTALAASMPMTVHTVEGLVVDQEVWLGSVSFDAQIESQLRASMGRIMSGGIALGRMGGWDALMLSILHRASQTDGGSLGDRVFLRSMSFSDRRASIEIDEGPTVASPLLSHLVQMRPFPTVRQVTLSVAIAGMLCPVTIDEDGIRSIRVPLSVAGLWVDRVRRRVRDVQRVVELLDAAFSKVLADAKA